MSAFMLMWTLARAQAFTVALLSVRRTDFTPDQNGHLQTIAQLGGVSIGADVRVGAGTTIDRGAIDNTVIEDGVKWMTKCILVTTAGGGSQYYLWLCRYGSSTVIEALCDCWRRGYWRQKPYYPLRRVTISVMTTIRCPLINRALIPVV